MCLYRVIISPLCLLDREVFLRKMEAFKNMKRSLSVLLIICLLISLVPFHVLGADTVQLTVKGRQGAVLLQTERQMEEAETALTLIQKGLGDERLEIAPSSFGAYVTGVKQEDGTWLRAGDDGMYSGWLYRVNGAEGTQSAEYCSLNAGDQVEFYYSDGSTSVDSLDKTLQTAANYLYQNISAGSKGWFYKDWQVIALAGAGFAVSEEYTEKTAPEVIKKLLAGKTSITDLERFSLSFALTGNDIRNLQGFDLIETIYNCSREKMLRQGNNGPVYAALLLHSLDYEVPEDAVWTKAKLLEELAKTQNSDGGFALSPGDPSDIDITAMVLQALAFDKTAYQQQIDQAVDYLSRQQQEDGGYISAYSGDSSESVAQAIIGLAAVGVNPETDSRFIKNYNNLLANLMSYQKPDGGFGHLAGDTASMPVSTGQAMMALQAYKKFQQGQGHYFDFSNLNLSVTTRIPAVSKNVLRSLYLECESLSTEGFSASSAEAFQRELRNTKTILEDKAAQENDLEKAYRLLTQAKNNLSGKAFAILSIEKNAVNQGFVFPPQKVELDGETSALQLVKKVLGDRVTIQEDAIVSIQDGGEAGTVSDQMAQKLDEQGIVPQPRKAAVLAKGDVTQQSKYLVQAQEGSLEGQLIRIAFTLDDGKDIGWAQEGNYFPAVNGNGAFLAAAALNGIDRDTYGPMQLAKIEKDLNQLSVLLNSFGSEQAEWDALETTLSGRLAEVPKKALEEQIAAAEEKHASDYTSESFQAMQACLKAAKEVFEDIRATSSEAALAASSLETSVGNLQSTGGGSPQEKTVELTVTLQEINAGTMINHKNVPLSDGDSVYDILAREAGEANLETTGSGNTVYVAGIRHNGKWYREFDKGAKSGWIYTINGSTVSKSCGAVYPKAGDKIIWKYKVDGTGSAGGSSGGGGGGTTVIVTPAPVSTPAPYQKKVEEAFSSVAQSMRKKEEWTEWEAFTLGRMGFRLPENGMESIRDTVVEAQGGFRKVTDLERYILTLTANGFDASSYEGMNLIEKMLNHENMMMQGINGPAFALIALDSTDYGVPENTKWNRQSLLNAILESQNKDGSFSLEKGGEPDPDLTAMAIQAMAAYSDNTQVKAAADKAFHWLGEQQQNDGLFLLDGEKTSETVVQVIVALTAFAIDPAKDSRFVKNGENLVDALFDFQVSDTAYTHIKGQEADDMATEQAFYALAALKLFYGGEDRLFRIERLYRDQDEISDWALEYVKKAKERSIMTGDDQGRFLPQDCLTRAELTKILCELFDLERLEDRSNPFADVARDAWYTPYILACYEKGYVKGSGEECFSPDALLTREEMAVMIARALSLTGEGQRTDDWQEVSEWALEAVSAVMKENIMTPYEGKFDPKGNVTREMAAVIAVRLSE